MARPQCDIALVSFWKVIYFIPIRPIWFPSNVFANTLIEGKRTWVLFIGGKKKGFSYFISRASRGSKGKNYKLKKGGIITSCKAHKAFYFGKVRSFKLYISTKHFQAFICFTLTKVSCEIIHYLKGGLKAN